MLNFILVFFVVVVFHVGWDTTSIRGSAREEKWWQKIKNTNEQIWMSSVLLCLLLHVLFSLTFLCLLLPCVFPEISLTCQTKNVSKAYRWFTYRTRWIFFMFTRLLCFLPVVCKRINTVSRLWISRQGLPSLSRPPRVFSYPKPHAKLMTVVFLSAPLPRPFKHNECV